MTENENIAVNADKLGRDTDFVS